MKVSLLRLLRWIQSKLAFDAWNEYPQFATAKVSIRVYYAQYFSFEINQVRISPFRTPKYFFFLFFLDTRKSSTDRNYTWMYIWNAFDHIGKFDHSILQWI